MKKLMTASALMFVMAASASITPAALINEPGIVSLTKQVNAIVVYDGIKIEICDNESSSWMQAKDDDLAGVKWKIRNGVLFLEKQKGATQKDITLKLNVHAVNKITLDDECAVTTTAPLTVPKIFIEINGNAKADVSNNGRIYVSGGNGVTLKFEKKTGGVRGYRK